MGEDIDILLLYMYICIYVNRVRPVRQNVYTYIFIVAANGVRARLYRSESMSYCMHNVAYFKCYTAIVT